MLGLRPADRRTGVTQRESRTSAGRGLRAALVLAFVMAGLLLPAMAGRVAAGEVPSGQAAETTPGSEAAARPPKAEAKMNDISRTRVRVAHGDFEVVAEFIAAPGATRTVVMLPSYARGAGDFTAEFGSDLAQRVAAAGYRVLLPWPRNFAPGLTTGPAEGVRMQDLAADVAAILEAEGTPPATIIGHAFGNRVARMLATSHPHLVDRLILLAAGGVKPTPAPQREALVGLVFQPAASDEQRDAWLRTAFFAPGNDPSIWRKGWSMGSGTPQAEATRDTPVEDWWRGGNVPIHVVQAAQDTCAPAEDSSIPLKEALGARVELVTIQNAGHAMLPEQPQAVGDHVLDFLAR